MNSAQISNSFIDLFHQFYSMVMNNMSRGREGNRMRSWIWRITDSATTTAVEFFINFVCRFKYIDFFWSFFWVNPDMIVDLYGSINIKRVSCLYGDVVWSIRNVVIVRVLDNEIIWTWVGIAVICFKWIHCMIDNLRGGVASCESAFWFNINIITWSIFSYCLRNSGSDNSLSLLFLFNLGKSLHFEIIH